MCKTKTASFLFLFLILLSSCKKGNEEKESPNIIVFLVDDMGLMDTSVPFLLDAQGDEIKYPLNSFYQTPNMEKLAEQGIRFANFYAHSVCSPTRTSIMSGQNSARHGVTNWIYSESNNRTEYGPQNWNWKGLTKESVTLPRLLQQAGYKTIHIGKAHFGPFNSDGENPINLGFDINIAGNSFGHPGSYYGQEGYGNLSGQKARAVPDLEQYHNSDVFLTEALTIEAKKEITNAVRDEKSFFLYLSHYAVHAPFQSDQRFASDFAASDKSEKAQAYATLVKGIDKSLGDIVNHIKDLGIGENTILLFLGDNGSDAPLPDLEGYHSSAPLKGKKGHHWEGGMRVPFIASWVTPTDNSIVQGRFPIAQNKIHEQIGTVIDILPTICNLVGISPSQDYKLDGFNLQPQLAGQNNTERKASFLNHFPHGNHRSNYFTSLVNNNWKIIYHYQVEDQARYELYNLKNDPFEMHNLANENSSQLKEMASLLAKELNHYDALYPEKDGDILELIVPE